MYNNASKIITVMPERPTKCNETPKTGTASTISEIQTPGKKSL
jgi:hypothetical protein